MGAMVGVGRHVFGGTWEGVERKAMNTVVAL